MEPYYQYDGTVYLTLYSKGGVKPGIAISLHPKIVIWNAELYFRIFA